MKSKVKLILVWCFLMVMNSVNGFAFIAEELDTVVVTATRLEEDHYKVAGNVTVITKEQIEASNAQNIADVLKETLGVFVYDQSTSKTTVVDLRGFGDTAARNVLVLINGRKVNSPDISGPDLIQVPIGAVERIEIIRGAGSVLYGDNAVGGVINVITKKGTGEPKGRVGGLFGSYNKQGTDVEFSGEKKGFSFYVYSQYLDDRGYRQNSDVFSKDFNSQIGYEVSEHLNMSLDMGYHEDDYGLPGGLSVAELQSLGPRASTTEDDFASTEDRYIKLGLDVTPWLDDTYKGNFVVDLYYRNRDVYDSFNSFGEYNTKRSIDTKGVTVKYVFDRPIFDKDVNFVTGVDYYDYENDITGSGSNTDVLTISKAEQGVFGFLQYELIDNVFVNAGTRYQRAEYDFNQTASTVTTENRKPDELVSMVGVKYEYAKGSNIHLNYQETFRFLATDEWYSTFAGLNTDLEQQTGYQVEMGVKHNFDDRVIVTLTPYFIELENEIFFNPNSGFFGSNDNYDKTQRLGIEIGKKVDVLKFLQIDFLDGLDVFSNLSYELPQFTDGPNDGKDIPMVARQQASHGVVLKFLKHYNLSLVGRYVGSRFAINDTQNATGRHKSYYVADAKVSFDHDHFEVYTGVNNMFDKKYSPSILKSASGPAKDFFPAPERNFVVGVNFKF